MTIGALVDKYGFSPRKGRDLDDLIAQYRRCKGLEIWKLSTSWSCLEPAPGRVDEEILEGLRLFAAAAAASGARAQIGIQQQNFPEWINDGAWDNENRYRYPQTLRLCATWTRLARALWDAPGLDSYLLINEENHVRDAEAYLRSMARVQAAVRAADPNPTHRVTIRPNTRDPFVRARIASAGAQDYDYGSGGYPTSAAWYFKKYASPRSKTACMRMADFHASPLAFGGPGGLGEIGFFVRPPQDAFGDPERLWGFQRAMEIAWEMGMDEFSLWGGRFGFDDLDAYYPRLIAFRDALLERPRPAGFDARIIADTGEGLVRKGDGGSRLDMAKQPFAPAFAWLDARGYVWFWTTPEAMALQTVRARADIRLSELSDKDAAAQEALLAARLAEVRPSGSPKPWPDNPG
jgi:hypothetical protein